MADDVDQYEYQPTIVENQRKLHRLIVDLGNKFIDQINKVNKATELRSKKTTMDIVNDIHSLTVVKKYLRAADGIRLDVSAIRIVEDAIKDRIEIIKQRGSI